MCPRLPCLGRRFQALCKQAPIALLDAPTGIEGHRKRERGGEQQHERRRQAIVPHREHIDHEGRGGGQANRVLERNPQENHRGDDQDQDQYVDSVQLLRTGNDPHGRHSKVEQIQEVQNPMIIPP